ncbi:hypothetical protein NBRGN_110_00110 [Nocardia brasiliensis NBRC 14402]|uniref:hypothetical protein n=1 Tax=Nocardia brasiliensis TaxID=37326 RepID=UPI000319DD05|nr:hypothetical protein [Nocardia brasiliensis]ASF09664.1 hypothetical protein CEQ30_22440 [Nocardia brasiliensis]GAJ86349.1 hypothetical protein NBRGN_110_00110 [Nocardia brasiliensis NBRC 14402]SUB55302.1 Uncharacterised protein [Nocardia brasiliensis]
MPGSGRPSRRGTTFLGATAVAVFFLLVAGLLGACSDNGSTAAQLKVTDPGTADCAAGGQAVAGLRDTFRALSDQLNGLGPAAQRGDLTDVKSRVAQGIRLSDQVTATIHPAVERMGSPLIGSTYRDVATAGGGLRSALAEFAAALDADQQAQPAADAVSTALTSLNTAMDRMRRACPTVFPDQPSPTYGPAVRRR